ncbi:MAG: hypothetical protein A2075_11800 [Geobacteraceae bacterium GWC2_58_44]|nr:MAG: hypothetical protein A2075_11800 [Geobacteraceae bacterium GWC2_58_44]HBG07957.1 hypothetical protein [Geobacter sp.]
MRLAFYARFIKLIIRNHQSRHGCTQCPLRELAEVPLILYGPDFERHCTRVRANLGYFWYNYACREGREQD